MTAASSRGPVLNYPLVGIALASVTEKVIERDYFLPHLSKARIGAVESLNMSNGELSSA
ncbi:uncharacterized protein ARMOST_12140 [Armillaria ostoyae]|uniref:Uncharacterized protein n=1 Tax=Armillaria ostoyae TaxID=47428 RepID=A0A284RJ38_ARMOS|nr:uncharacterized protein ARMOST_12140 [Armillaria ostoyae]